MLRQSCKPWQLRARDMDRCCACWEFFSALTAHCRPFTARNLWIHALQSAMSKAAPLRTLHVLLLAVAVVLFGVALLLRQGGGLCAQKTGPLFFETSWLSGGAAVLQHASGDAAHHGGDGGAGAAQQLGQRGCPTSEEVAASPWASSCYHLTKVCVDNGETLGRHWRCLAPPAPTK